MNITKSYICVIVDTMNHLEKISSRPQTKYQEQLIKLVIITLNISIKSRFNHKISNIPAN